MTWIQLINNLLSIPDYELQTFTPAQKNVIHNALQDWGNASGITFVEVNETNSTYGEIRFHLLNFNISRCRPLFQSGGFAFFPGQMTK